MRVNRKVNFFSSRGGDRTRTNITVQQILSLSCLPIPPPNQTLLQIFFRNVLAVNKSYGHIKVN